ncbi:MAG: peptide deformylase [bacterium]
MILTIKRYGNPILRKEASDVRKIDEKIRKIASDMIETLIAANGLGLAGNQVGILKRIIVVRIKEKPFVILNPKAISTSGIVEEASEGCLSFPSLFGNVQRAFTITFRGLNINGDEITGEISGLPARAIQHEIDHLDGILFIDRMDESERKKLLALWRKIKIT